MPVGAYRQSTPNLSRKPGLSGCCPIMCSIASDLRRISPTRWPYTVTTTSSELHPGSFATVCGATAAPPSNVRNRVARSVCWKVRGWTRGKVTATAHPLQASRSPQASPPRTLPVARFLNAPELGPDPEEAPGRSRLPLAPGGISQGVARRAYDLTRISFPSSYS